MQTKNWAWKQEEGGRKGGKEGKVELPIKMSRKNDREQWRSHEGWEKIILEKQDLHDDSQQ